MGGTHVKVKNLKYVGKITSFNLLFQIPASELSRGYGGEDDLKLVQT